MIALRVASAMGADRIAVLDEGRIEGMGTHEELLGSDAIYRDLYRTQMTGADTAATIGEGGGADGRI